MATVVAALIGCAGGSSDGPPPDSSVTIEPDVSCVQAGIEADCDPVAVTGCAVGSCYVLKTAGSACACPGSVATEGACSTTVECEPGNVCAGTAPPGVCRKTCVPTGSACAGGMTCTPVQGFNQFGFCEPEAP